MLSIKHGIAVTRPYVKRLLTMDGIRDLQKSDNRQLRQIMLGEENTLGGWDELGPWIRMFLERNRGPSPS